MVIENGKRLPADDSIPMQVASGLYDDYSTLKNSAGLLSFEGDGIATIDGPDSVAWLHKMVTVDIQALQPGRGAYGLLLNGTAHVLGDFIVLAQTGSFLIYTSERAKEKLFSNLRRSVFREKVTLARLDDRLSVLSVQGPLARQVLDKTFASLPPLEPFQCARDGESLVIRNPRAGSDGFDLLIPRANVQAIHTALSGQGVRSISPDSLNVARIEAGIAWYGVDFDETMLAPEARLDPHIAQNKGCYPGQEVIARIHNRGHVNRLLVQFKANGETVPERGDLIFSEEREVGWITSSAWSFEQKAPIALGYIRRELAEKGKLVHIVRGADSLAAQVVGP